ncbi:hypothetical protein NUW58_g4153 [Xylaria curta]|uniref:Uncharacterized protein n=1 Tax=Xylaria curta TaxID=42375 RepID=A0ACC1P957_9PEZI|nr:hypothetical protein NUW58_g4153 [Xylaria curta]
MASPGAENMVVKPFAGVRGKRRAGEQRLDARPPKRVNKNGSQKKQAKVRRPKASNIEKSMPLEILERIFWLSENVNFPRAAPRLGRLLSGPSTLRETFLSAFGPRGSFGWEDDLDRFGGNPGFQTDILACSWATIDVILNCRDIWVRRHARNLPFQYFPLWGDPMSPSPYMGSGVTVGISEIKEARCYFYHDYNAFRNIERQSAYSGYLTERNPNTWIDVHRSTEIPDDLIVGPWDEGSLQKFFWLVQAGARLSSGQTWEVTHEGFRNAISDYHIPNLTIIRLLDILGAFQKWPQYIRKDECNTIDPVMAISKRENDTTLYEKYTYVKSLLLDHE